MASMPDDDLIARLDEIRYAATFGPAAHRCRGVPEMLDRLVLDIKKLGSVKLADIDDEPETITLTFRERFEAIQDAVAELQRWRDATFGQGNQHEG